MAQSIRPIAVLTGPVWDFTGTIVTPRHTPITHALFNCVDDLGRDAGVHVVLFGCGMLVFRHRENSPFAVFRSRQVFAHLPIPLSCIARINQIIEGKKLLGVSGFAAEIDRGGGSIQNRLGVRWRGRYAEEHSLKKI
jgi:hypothetical protein